MSDLWSSNADDARVQRQDDMVAERDAAGELGTLEPYWDEWVADPPIALPRLAENLARPTVFTDPHGYHRLVRIFSWTTIILGLPAVGFLAGYIAGGLST